MYTAKRRYKLINKNKPLILVFIFMLPFIKINAGELTPYKLPDTHVVPIHDTVSDRQYELYIKLPEGYSTKTQKKYPVIYYTDAVWHIEIISTTTAFLMEDAILVGISWQKDINEDLLKSNGAHVSRNRDYSIRKLSNLEKQAKFQAGQASNHLNFIRNDVIKHVEKIYRTDPDNRTYFGYSLGGLFGAYILMAQPDTFKNYILGSPALWKDLPKLSELGSKHQQFDANVYISFGSLEDQSGRDILEFVTLLKKRKDKSLSLKLEVIEGDHGTAFPMTGVRSITWLSKLQNGK